MQSTKCFLGNDVAKAELEIGVIPESKTWTVSNDGRGIKELIDGLVTLSPSVIVIESTGGYETLVASSLATVQLPVVVINLCHIIPVRDFFRSCPLRNYVSRTIFHSN